jgi:two-component system sporulation sensor kinase B
MVNFVEVTKHLFLNLSILFILLLFCLIYFDKSKKFTLSKTSATIVFIILLWICIHFAYHPVSYYRYDVRIIPFLIGGFYFGIGPILALSILVIRSFYGMDIGLLQSLILYATFALLIMKISPWFWKQTSSRRIFITICFALVLGCLTIAGMEVFYSKNFWLDAWFAYLVVPPFGIGLIAYIIEFVQKSVEMRQQLIKSEKLKAVEQMGAAISHEIRNPLTAASGFVHLLQDDALPRHKRREYLALVKDELMSAERVIQDYLTFAKPALDRIEEINVKSELRQIINIVQPLANQNSVEILTDFSIIGFIKGDRQKFRQCFVNVLKNAIEAMPNGGTLTVTTEFNQNDVSILVKDNGIGMTQEQLERLGEPFYSTKGKNGTGLGMMVVYSIVRAMNGDIQAESEVGAGTSFYFTFSGVKTI